MRSYEMTEIGKRGLDACLDEAFEIALDECDAVFLSVDIDVCDPGHAPGTGTPEPGGLSVARAARRRTPDLPRAARSPASTWSRCRRPTTTPRSRRSSPTGSASRRSPGWPPRRSASPTTRPARCWKALMATLFTGGSVFDGHRHLPGARPAGRGRQGRRGARPGGLGRALDASSTTRWSTWPAGWCRPGSPTRTCTRSRAGWSGCAATCPRARTREEYLADGPRVRRPRTRRRVDPRRRLGDGGVPRWHADARPTSTPSCPTGRCSCPTATTTAPGSTRGPSSSPASPPSTPDPPDGRIERLPDGSPPGHPARGRDGPRRPADCRCPTGAEYAARAARGPGATCSRSASPAWQDAIVGAYAGMDDTGSTYVERDRERRPRRRRRRRAVVGPRARARSRSPTWSSAARRAVGRPVPGDERQDHAGRRLRELHRRACSSPYLDGHGHATDNAGHSFVDAEELKEVVVALRGRGLPGARARDRRPRRPRGARRLRGRAGSRPRRATCATTSRTSRWSTPTTCRASPSSASRPTCRRCGPPTSRRWTS